jgi:hypothetical protein
MTRSILAFSVLSSFVMAGCDPAVPAGEIAICDSADPGVLVTDASINGDTLTADVGYSGCDTVEITACWHDGSFMESDPVQARLALLAVGAGACTAAFEDTATIDISGLRAAYEDAYRTESGTIIVNLNGATVDYSF